MVDDRGVAKGEEDSGCDVAGRTGTKKMRRILRKTREMKRKVSVNKVCRLGCHCLSVRSKLMRYYRRYIAM